MAGKKLNIKVNSYDELFGSETQTAGVVEIPLGELYGFKDHPFHVVDDEKMAELAESIREYGVLEPGIVRKRPEGGYEIISGHRRKRACELAEMETMPVIIRDYSDTESVWSMVDANIQRENILPSEKARAYKMKYDAIRHQGSKSLNGKDSLTNIGEAANESAKTVQRYINLARLNDDLMQMVDEKRIRFMQGVDLSFLNKKEQRWVYNCMFENQANLSKDMSERLKTESQTGTLTRERVRMIITKRRQRSKRVLIREELLDQYFPLDMSEDEIEDVIVNLLNEWKSKKCG